MHDNNFHSSSINLRTSLRHALAAAVTAFMPAIAAQAQAQEAQQGPDPAAAAPAATMPATAAEGPPSRPWYLGLSLGRVIHPPVDEFDSGRNGALSATFGYRFRPHWAVEVFMDDLSVGTSFFDEIFRTRTGGPAGHLGAGVVGEWPLATHVALRGRLGIGSTFIRSDISEAQDRDISDPSIGVGLTLGPVGRIAFKLDATRYGRSHVTTRTVGAELRF